MARFVRPAIATMLIAGGLAAVDTAALGIRAVVVGAAVAVLAVEHRWGQPRHPSA